MHEDHVHYESHETTIPVPVSQFNTQMTEESASPRDKTALESAVSTHITQDSTENTDIVTENFPDVTTDLTSNAIASTDIWEISLVDDKDLNRTEQTLAILETQDINENGYERNVDILDGKSTNVEYHESGTRNYETSNAEGPLPSPSRSPGGTKSKSWKLKKRKKRKVSQTSFDFSPTNIESNQGEEKRQRVFESETPRKMSIFQRIKQKLRRRKDKTQKKKETESSSDCLTLLEITNESKLPQSEDGTDESTTNDTLSKQFIAMERAVKNIVEPDEYQTAEKIAESALTSQTAEGNAGHEREVSTIPQDSTEMTEKIEDVVISNSTEIMSIPHESTKVKRSVVHDQYSQYSIEKPHETKLPNEGEKLSEGNEITQTEQKQNNDSNTGSISIFFDIKSGCISEHDAYARDQRIPDETVQNKANGLAEATDGSLNSEKRSELEEIINKPTDVEFVTDENITYDTLNTQIIDMKRVLENIPKTAENQTEDKIAECLLIPRPAEDNLNQERGLSTTLQGSTEITETNIKECLISYSFKDESKQSKLDGTQPASDTEPGDFAEGQSISNEPNQNKINDDADDAKYRKSDQGHGLANIVKWTTDVTSLTDDEFVTDERTANDNLNKQFADTRRGVDNITEIVENQTTDKLTECPLTKRSAENNLEHERGYLKRPQGSIETMETIKVSKSLEEISVPRDRTKVKRNDVPDEQVLHSDRTTNKTELSNEGGIISEYNEINKSKQKQLNDSNTGRALETFPIISVPKKVSGNLKEELVRHIFSGTQSDLVQKPNDELISRLCVSNETQQNTTNGLTKDDDTKYWKSYRSSELEDILNCTTDVETLTHDEFVETVCKLREKIDQEETPEDNIDYDFLTESEMNQRLEIVQTQVHRGGRETFQDLVIIAAKQKKLREDRQEQANQARNSRANQEKLKEDERMVYYTPNGVIKLMRKMHYGGYMGRRYRLYLKIKEKKEREEQAKLTPPRLNNDNVNGHSAAVFDKSGDGNNAEKNEKLQRETGELNTNRENLKIVENEVSDGDNYNGRDVDLQISGYETADEDAEPGTTLDEILVKHWNYDEKRERIIEKEWISWDCEGFAVEPEVKKQQRRDFESVEWKFMMNKTRKSYFLGKERLNRSHNAAEEALKNYEFGCEVFCLQDEQTAARQDVWEVLKQLLLTAEVPCLDHRIYTDELPLWQRKRRRHLMLLY